MKQLIKWYIWLVLAVLLSSGCQPQISDFSSDSAAAAALAAAPTPGAAQTSGGDEQLILTPLPERPVYAPGELVDYIAQTGDTLPVLAIRFNTTVEEIREANPFIPASATTMPPGMPMKIPIYYQPFWGSAYQILPDSQFVNGPSQLGFDTDAFIATQPGWLKDYREYAAGAHRSAGEIIDLVALNFSLSPRLLLGLLEYQSSALTQAEPLDDALTYPLGYRAGDRKGLYRQLMWAANLLNDGYYRWRIGNLVYLEHEDGRIERFDPWQNAATISLHMFLNTLLDKSAYLQAISPDGLARAYQVLFGDVWASDQPHIPGSLEQPAFKLPFEAGKKWAYTGGPHTAWGSAMPYSALDFAPPLTTQGCQPTHEWVTAIAPGVVVRSDVGEVVLDLDGDGDERTGWNIFYLHVATVGRATLGTVLATGDPVGHPSCEGGTSTGTHVHIARKYNGEWIPAEGILAFNLEGWVAHNGSRPYLGTLTRLSHTVIACDCSNQESFIESGTP